MSLLKYLKNMSMQANFKPIVIKTLLEKGFETSFTAPLEEVKENIVQLNFDRDDFEINDAVTSVMKALSEYVVYDKQNVSLNYHFTAESDILECLKICGQKIMQWHIEHILNDKKLDIWRVLPGTTESNLEFEKGFSELNSIGVGYGMDNLDLTNLTIDEVKKECDRIFTIKYPQKQQAPPGMKASVTAITHKITAKDIVVLTRGEKEVIDFGIVISKYFFNKKSESGWNQRRNVVWFNQGPISKTVLPFISKGPSSAIWKFSDESKEKILEYILESKNYFIITSYPDSKYGDKEGKQYEFPSHIPDAKLFVGGINFIVQTRIDDQNHFVGYGKVQEITKKQVTNEKGKSVTMCTANYSQYREFFTPKLRTSEIKDKMQWIAFPNTGNGVILPSMLAIPHSFYDAIMGEYLTHNQMEVDTVNLNNPDPHLEKLYKILERKKQIIFYGPPGTGKTFSADKLKDYILSKNHISSNNPANPTLLDSQNWIFVTSEEHWNIIKSKKVWGSIAKPENIREKIHPGDKVIFYVKGSKIFKGSFEFQDDWYPSESGIWTDESTVDYKSQINLKELEYFDVDISILKETESYASKLENGWPKNKIISLTLRSTNGYPANNATPISETDYKKICSNSSSIGSTIVNNQNFSKNVTFHQSYSYEDFVEGIRPVIKSDKVIYEPKDGIFKEICELAKNDSQNKYVLTIDEINRGNVSKIFGELITLIESDKRKEKYQVTLPYTRKLFWIPENLFIIGTMNTADRSIAQLDTALRRRFAFEELMPEPNLKELDKSIDGISLKNLLSTLNSRIRAEGPQFRDKQIGHSYFMEINNLEDLQITFAVEIIPLLQDYFYQNYKKLEEKILNSDFIDSSKDEIKFEWKNNEKIFKEAINKILT